MLRFLRHHLIVYLIMGGLNTIISLLIFYGLLKLNVNYLVANVICFVIGVLLGYILNTLIVFKAKLYLRSLLKYSSVYLSSILLNIVLLFVLVHFIELNKMLAQIITVAVTTVVNYLMIRKIVFIRK